MVPSVMFNPELHYSLKLSEQQAQLMVTWRPAAKAYYAAVPMTLWNGVGCSDGAFWLLVCGGQRYKRLLLWPNQKQRLQAKVCRAMCREPPDPRWQGVLFKATWYILNNSYHSCNIQIQTHPDCRRCLSKECGQSSQSTVQ